MIGRGAKNLIVSGTPGVGKTSLLKECLSPYRDVAGGFYTEQILEGGKRMGFRVVSLSGESKVLASKAMASSVRLNKYGIDLAALDGLAVPAIEAAGAGGRIVVIDEIGAMEAFSERFRTAALACLQGAPRVLATIRHGAHDFSDAVKRLDDTRLLELDRSNYHAVKKEVDAWLKSAARVS
ncbi:MAG: hypothetical protein HY078_17485 [Elusimicrobia bacterium]|nr:hypothetical protein [Elusimicrobiota bacterium]